MDRAEIRSMVRTILTEELGRNQNRAPEKPDPRQEVIRIGSDQDLAAFIKRLARMCGDETVRREIEQGTRSFRLEAPASSSPGKGPKNGQPARFDKGFINERQIDALTEGTEVVVVTRAVRFTPLAMDRLRQRGIRIERKAS